MTAGFPELGVAAVPKHPDFGFTGTWWSVEQRTRDAVVNPEQGFQPGRPGQQAVDQASAAVDDLCRDLDQALTERAEVHADDAVFVGLTFLLRDRRAGFRDRQPSQLLRFHARVAMPLNGQYFSVR